MRIPPEELVAFLKTMGQPSKVNGEPLRTVGMWEVARALSDFVAGYEQARIDRLASEL